jgi:hypothetical protein
MKTCERLLFMLGIKAEAGTDFDPKILLSANKKVVQKFLAMYGQDVRRAARRMMKKGKKPKPGQPPERSKPGEAPRNQTGVYKGLIKYAVSDDKKNVVIGPEQFQGKSEGAKALEYGGVTTLTIRPSRPPKAKVKRKPVQRGKKTGKAKKRVR